jgi:hypothetical protein
MDNFVRFDDLDSRKTDNKPVATAGDKSETTTKRKLAQTHRSKSPKKAWVTVLIVAVVVVIAGLTTLTVWQYKQAEYLKTPEGVAEAAKLESESLVSKVSLLIKLPDEEAVVATVDDKDKLREQPFFADVENGDKVLIFSAASKAVVYRPSENRIINSGPIAITAEDDAATEATEVPVSQ